VPAKAVSPSSNFVWAKFLASVTVSNVLVIRGLRLFSNSPRFCTSKVTYHVCAIPLPEANITNAHLAFDSSNCCAGLI